MSRAARIGIFGGTFNPIHLGHLRAAEEVLEALALERMLFVPSGEPPHKSASAGDPIAPAAQRLAWVRAAIADNPRFAVDALEVERAGTSYSVETLRTLGGRIAPGLAGLRDRDRRLRRGRNVARARGAVYPRELRRDHAAGATRSSQRATGCPSACAATSSWRGDGCSARHRSAGTWVRRLEIAALDISASDIRARLRCGRSVRYLLPETILEAVLRSRVYAQ